MKLYGIVEVWRRQMARRHSGMLELIGRPQLLLEWLVHVVSGLVDRSVVEGVWGHEVVISMITVRNVLLLLVLMFHVC